MRVGSSRATTRNLIAALALAALSLRALIPAGFMPAPGRLFALELCPDGLPSGVLAVGTSDGAGMSDMSDMPGMSHIPGISDRSGLQQHRGARFPPHRHPVQIEHCVFGGATALALVAHLPVLGLLLPAHVLPPAQFAPQRTGWFLLRIPLPRGPPAIA